MDDDDDFGEIEDLEEGGGDGRGREYNPYLEAEEKQDGSDANADIKVSGWEDLSYEYRHLLGFWTTLEEELNGRPCFKRINERPPFSFLWHDDEVWRFGSELGSLRSSRVYARESRDIALPEAVEKGMWKEWDSLEKRFVDSEIHVAKWGGYYSTSITAANTLQRLESSGSDPSDRASAIRALVLISKPTDAPAIAALLKRLHDRDASVRRVAASALKSFDISENFDAIRRIASTSLQDSELDVREAAMDVLRPIMEFPCSGSHHDGKGGGGGEDHVEMKFRKITTAEAVGDAVEGRLDREIKSKRRVDVAEIVEMSLLRGIENSNGGVQKWCWDSLLGLVDQDSGEWIAKELESMALDDRRPIEWRSFIAQAYCHYRPKSAAKQDKEFLLHVARVVHPDLNVRVHACREMKGCTLDGHGEVRRVTDVLLEACNDLDSQVRTAAAEAAFAIASWQDTKVKEAMIRLRHDRSASVRSIASKAIKAIDAERDAAREGNLSES